MQYILSQHLRKCRDSPIAVEEWRSGSKKPIPALNLKNLDRGEIDIITLRPIKARVQAIKCRVAGTGVIYLPII